MEEIKKNEYDENGYDKDGYDKEGYNISGFNREGIHRETGTEYDKNGYNKEGYNIRGFNIDGFDKDGNEDVFVLGEDDIEWFEEIDKDISAEERKEGVQAIKQIKERGKEENTQEAEQTEK